MTGFLKIIGLLRLSGRGPLPLAPLGRWDRWLSLLAVLAMVGLWLNQTAAALDSGMPQDAS